MCGCGWEAGSSGPPAPPAAIGPDGARRLGHGHVPLGRLFALRTAFPSSGHRSGATCHDCRVDGRPGVDPREVLGVAPGADVDEVTAAFRRLAKQWHPDTVGDRAAADRMALINAAYAALRVPGPPPSDERGRPGGATAPAAGEGLAPAVRRALGHELRRALEPGEAVRLVVPAATWASPQTILAVTDRRLLWLLDDAPVHRVRELRFGELRQAAVRRPRPWRRRAQVVLEDRRGRRTSFGELAPETAAAIVRRADLGARPTHDRPAV